MKERYPSRETREKVCGKLQAEHEKKDAGFLVSKYHQLHKTHPNLTKRQLLEKTFHDDFLHSAVIVRRDFSPDPSPITAYHSIVLDFIDSFAELTRDQSRNWYAQQIAKQGVKEEDQKIEQLKQAIAKAGKQASIQPSKGFNNFPMTPVQSSFVKGAGVYKNHLLVQYHHTPEIWGYPLTNKKAGQFFQELMASGSKGGWVWDELLGKPSQYGMAKGKFFAYEKDGKSHFYTTPGAQFVHLQGRPAMFSYNPVGYLGGGQKAYEAQAKEWKEKKVEGYEEALSKTPKIQEWEGLGTSRKPWAMPKVKGKKKASTPSKKRKPLEGKGILEELEEWKKKVTESPKERILEKVRQMKRAKEQVEGKKPLEEIPRKEKPKKAPTPKREPPKKAPKKPKKAPTPKKPPKEPKKPEKEVKKKEKEITQEIEDKEVKKLQKKLKTASKRKRKEILGLIDLIREGGKKESKEESEEIRNEYLAWLREKLKKLQNQKKSTTSKALEKGLTRVIDQLKARIKVISKMDFEDLIVDFQNSVSKDYMGAISRFGRITYLGNVKTSYHVDKINTEDFAVDFTEDYTTMWGPITHGKKGGYFEYRDKKNPDKTIKVYKDYETLKEVHENLDYYPVIGTTGDKSHKAGVIGFTHQFEPHDDTEEIYGETVLFNDLASISNIPEHVPRQISIGFVDEIKGDVQYVRDIDHLAMSLDNKEIGRCQMGGNGCYMEKREDTCSLGIERITHLGNMTSLLTITKKNR